MHGGTMRASVFTVIQNKACWCLLTFAVPDNIVLVKQWCVCVWGGFKQVQHCL